MESQNIMELEALMPVRACLQRRADRKQDLGIPESLPVYPRH